MKTPNPKPILLVALGGNALIRKGQKGTIEEQFENLKVPIRQIARLSRKYRIITTHGNGPQVGNLLLQQESCREVPQLPLEILVAQTQGQIGYMIESTLDSQLMELGIHSKPIVSLISYVVVDEN
ncbi:MAG: carbamate kinase, partial [Desulfobacterales bacterium]